MRSRWVSRWRIRGALLLIGFICPGFAPPLLGAPPPFPSRLGIADGELDRIRGGFVLPNGMDVAVGISIETLVNGILALRTELTATGGAPPAVFIGTGGVPVASGAEGAPAIRTSDGTMIRVSEGAPRRAAEASDQQRVELTSNGPAALTPMGSLQLMQGDSGSTVVLQGDSLELRHMIGRFTGSIVANTANDRTIDTVVTVNVDLQGSTIPLGNAILRLESIAVDAASRAVR